MENLKSNVITLLVIELIITLIVMNRNWEIFNVFFVMFAFSVNTTGIVLLLNFRPKGYWYLVAILLATIIIPISFFFFAMSTIQC